MIEILDRRLSIEPSLMQRRVALAAGIVLLSSSCGGVPADTTEGLATTTSSSTTESVLPREFTAQVAVLPNGLSESVRFEVPPATRAIFIEATGEAEDLIAIGSLRLTDGVELFGLESFGDVRTMLDTTIREQILRSVPGLTFQEAGQGRFTWIHPRDVTPGEITLQMASTGDTVEIAVSFPEANGANGLALDVFVVNDVDTFLLPALVPLITVSDMFATAGIEISWGTLGAVDVPALEGVEPESQSDVDGILAELVAAAAPIGTDALDVFIVANLAFVTAQFDPRTPGSLLPSSIGGVLALDFFRPETTGAFIAHMLGHYLGIPHVEVTADDHSIIADGFSDTESDEGNFMDQGETISAEQAAAMLAHPLIGR